MTAPVSSVGRPADRKNLILQQLRRQIVAGEWLPGTQLPTRSEIVEMFGASPVTVQSALQHLRRDGFLVVKGKQGTYVAPNPPHLMNYALVFPSEPGGATWVRFWSALSLEASEIARARGINIAVYQNVNSHHNSEDYRKLTEEVLAHRLAGIIFASPPFETNETPILEEPGIPRVAIMNDIIDRSLPRVSTDVESFWNRAIEYVKARGCKRVAIVTPPHVHDFMEDKLKLLRDAGLTVEPQWVQRVHQAAPETAINLVHLLMHPSQTWRPQALIISDDNLAEPALEGLLRAGVKVPEDLEVVVHCNFPDPPSSVLPFKRLGYDAREVLNHCLSSIDEQRQGKGFGRCDRIFAAFGEELKI